MATYYLAIDIGASSGRHILGHVENGKILLEEVYRFENRQIHKDGHDCWDMENLRDGILAGLCACKDLGKIPVTVGIDTWAVDYVLLDGKGDMLGDAVAYRDNRTERMDELVEKIIPAKELYQRTGIQKQMFNTVYQLMALNREHPEQLVQAEALLMIPDYFNYRLTGVKKQEYTNATSTNLVNAADKRWDYELINRLGLPEKLFTELSMPGTVAGELLPEIQECVGFNTTVILPATHDTGSAFLAVPARDENAVYLSSGTWSLLGVENETPITTEASRRENFTNEGGAWYRFRYLKNIMGLWMIQSIRRELNGTDYVKRKTDGREDEKQIDHTDAKKVSHADTIRKRRLDGKRWEFPDLIAEAEQASSFCSVVDVNDDRFLAPESMIDAIIEYCKETGQAVPQSVGEIMQCVYLSLANCYRDAITSLSTLTGKTYTSINIVGGGCQDGYLNRMTAKATGLPVYAGPVEGTAIGNLLIQMMEGKEFCSLQEARDSIKISFSIEEVTQ